MRFTIWVNDHELGYATISNLKDFNAFMSDLEKVTNSPKDKAKKFRDVTKKFTIELKTGARVKKIDTPKSSLRLTTTDSTGATITLCVGSSRYTHRSEYVPAAKDEHYPWCLYPFNTVRVAVHKWDNEDWAIRVSDMDDTSYLKYYPNQKLANEEFDMLKTVGSITVRDIVGLGFYQE